MSQSRKWEVKDLPPYGEALTFEADIPDEDKGEEHRWFPMAYLIADNGDGYDWFEAFLDPDGIRLQDPIDLMALLDGRSNFDEMPPQFNAWVKRRTLEVLEYLPLLDPELEEQLLMCGVIQRSRAYLVTGWPDS